MPRKPQSKPDPDPADDPELADALEALGGDDRDEDDTDVEDEDDRDYDDAED